MQTSSNGFPLKLNSDGTYDSICPRCFLTVARQMAQAEIVREERKHVCTKASLKAAKRAKGEVRADL
jgi:hypothetical protein